jgi:hypothetical protein
MADVPLRPQHRTKKPWLWNRGFAIESMERLKLFTSIGTWLLWRGRDGFVVRCPMALFYDRYSTHLFTHCCHSPLLYFVNLDKSDLGESSGLSACRLLTIHPHCLVSSHPSELCLMEYHIGFPNLAVYRRALPQGYGSILRKPAFSAFPYYTIVEVGQEVL